MLSYAAIYRHVVMSFLLFTFVYAEVCSRLLLFPLFQLALHQDS